MTNFFGKQFYKHYVSSMFKINNNQLWFRRRSLIESSLPDRSLSWANNLQSELLVKNLPKKENKLPEYRLNKKTKQD